MLAVTVPLPTLQAATGVALFRHAPPSSAALASSPGGNWSVRSLVLSPLEGVKVMSVPRLPVEPAGTRRGRG